MNTDTKQLLHDLRSLSRLAPEAHASATAIERARAAALGAAPGVQPARKSRSIARRGLIGIAAAVLVVLVGLRWLTDAGTSLAFGQVQERVKETKSVQYIQRRKDRTKQNRLAPQEMRKVMILGPHRMREDVTMTTAGDPLPEGETWARGPDHYVMIHDYATGKMLSLSPQRKTYSLNQSVLGIDTDSGEVKEEKVQPQPQIDFYKRFREVPAERAQQLPRRTIDGRDVLGFQIVDKTERPSGVYTSTRTYWVDPRTKLPVRIETKLETTNPTMVDSEFVQSDFVFDAPLDESLFRTDPPRDYRPQ